MPKRGPRPPKKGADQAKKPRATKPAPPAAATDDLSVELPEPEVAEAVLASPPESAAPEAPPAVPAPWPIPTTIFTPDADHEYVTSQTLTSAMGEVHEQSDRRAADRRAPPPKGPGVSSALLALALASWLFAGALLLVRPGVARGPADHAWAPPAPLAEASLRYGLWLARARVEGFRAEHSRLPSFLAEAGVLDSSLALVVEGERAYVLEGQSGTLRLRLTHTMSADSFVGVSLEQLRGN